MSWARRVNERNLLLSTRGPERIVTTSESLRRMIEANVRDPRRRAALLERLDRQNQQDKESTP